MRERQGGEVGKGRRGREGSGRRGDCDSVRAGRWVLGDLRNVEREGGREEKEPVSKYNIMFYKNSNMIGVRQKFGDKKQIGSFGGKRCGRSEEGAGGR